MTHWSAVYILQTINCYGKTVAEREPIERSEAPGSPLGAETGHKGPIDDAALAQTPAEGAWGGMTTSLGSNAAFVCLAVQTGTLELVLFRLLRNPGENILAKRVRERPSQPPPRPCA